MSTQMLDRSAFFYLVIQLLRHLILIWTFLVTQMSTRVDALEASIQDIINGDLSVPQSPTPVPGTPVIRWSESGLMMVQVDLTRCIILFGMVSSFIGCAESPTLICPQKFRCIFIRWHGSLHSFWSSVCTNSWQWESKKRVRVLTSRLDTATLPTHSHSYHNWMLYMGCPECSYSYWYIFLLRGAPIFILEVRTTHPMVIFIGPGFGERDPFSIETLISFSSIHMRLEQ